MSDHGTRAAEDVATLLAGVRVVDLTFQAAGAYGAMLLAGLGAEVLKVESSVKPDPTRGRIKDRPYQHSVFFEDVNLGKRAIAINLKRPAGIALMRRLIGRSHAVLDNFRPGVLNRLGLDPDELIAQQPSLVCASLSAVGATGPLAALPGYAGIFNALSGFGEITGYVGGPPTEMRTSMDMRAGAAFATAVVAALVGAKRTGRGGRVDFSAAEAISMLCGDSIAEYSLAGQLPQRIGNQDAYLSPHGVYPTLDGWVFLAARDDTEWERLAELLAVDGVAVTPSWSGAALRRKDRAAVDAAVAEWTARRLPDDVVDRLQAIGLPAAAVYTGADILQDSSMRERRMLSRVQVATTVRDRAVCEMPWLIDGERPGYGPPPELGRDTRDVLIGVLGLTESEIADLARAGVLE